jgi:TatD DNase family protein
MAWTDSHCHVQYDGVGLGAVARAAAAGVTRVVTIGTDVARSHEAVSIVREGRDEGLELWATAGVHPHDANQGVEGLEPLLALPEVVGVGECGLDYYYEHSPREVQRTVFAAQISLAAATDLTLVVHTRDAWDDTFAVLDAIGVPERTIIHCFSGGADEARKCLDRGAYLSFSGIVTFKNAVGVRDAATLCPIDRLLVETDAPYLAPVPHRGKPNEPAWVQFVGSAIADARGAAVSAIEEATWRNAEQVFHLT